MAKVPKKRFDFTPTEGLVDVYLDDKKVRTGHNGALGHVYFHLTGDYKCDTEPMDPRVGIGAEIVDGELIDFKPKRTVKSAEVTQKASVEVRRPGSYVPRNDSPVPRGE